jgi:hypothetical protein
MKKWMVTLAAVGAVVALAAPAANATHGTAPTVDSIDGSGAGTFVGTLSAVDTADWYTFFGVAGTVVTIAMNAQFNAWDPFLTLYRPPSPPGFPAAGDLRASYTLVASDDDSGPGVNSLIQLVLPATGWYVVAAESFAGFGVYTLTISGSVFTSSPFSQPCPPYPIMAPCRIVNFP